MKNQIKNLMCVVDVLVHHVITRLGARGRTPSTNQLKFLIRVYLATLLFGMITGCADEKCVVCPPDQPAAEKEYYFLYNGGFDN